MTLNSAALALSYALEFKHKIARSGAAPQRKRGYKFRRGEETPAKQG